jgi:hypothetical protein
MNGKLGKIVAAVARAQGGNIVDLAQIESDVRIAILQRAIEEVWEYFGAGLIPAELAEQALQAFESKLLEEFIQQPIFTREQHARLAAHRAARGMRKV